LEFELSLELYKIARVNGEFTFKIESNVGDNWMKLLFKHLKMDRCCCIMGLVLLSKLIGMIRLVVVELCVMLVKKSYGRYGYTCGNWVITFVL